MAIADAYQNAKLQQLDEHTTFRVYGRAIETRSVGRWRLVVPCFCVQDSPENSCPCPPHVFWWLRSDMIVAEDDANRKDHDGNDLRYFDVLVESQILMETVQPVSAAALKSMGSGISARAIKAISDPDGGWRPGSGPIAIGPLGTIIFGILSGLIANAIYDGLKTESSDWNDLLQGTRDQLCKKYPWLPPC